MTPGTGVATAAIRRLRGVTWQWRDDAPPDAKQQPGMGVIAQEVEAVFPELVSTDELGHKRVEYDGLIAPLCSAVAELDDRVRRLEPNDQGRERTAMTERSDEHTDAVVRASRAAAGTSLDPREVERIFPQLVSTDETGNRVIAYEGLIGPLIEAVKELDHRVTTLEQRERR